MLVNMVSKTFFLMFFIFFFIISCKKKSDEVNPVITVTSPLSNSLIDLPNSIRVSGSANDNSKLKRLEINVVDVNLSPVSTKTSIELSTSQYFFDELILLNDPLIESGSYYIHLKASDQNNNFSSVFVEIQISGIQRVFKGLYFITVENGTSNLYSLDSIGGFALEKSITGNFQKAVANSRHQYFFIGTDQIGSSFEIENFSEIWEIPSYQTPYPFFSGLSLSESRDNLNIAFGDGVFRSFNKNGQIINTIYANAQEWFGEFYLDESYYVSEVFANVMNRFIVLFFSNSGIENQRIQIDSDIVKIIKYASGQYIVISEFQSRLKISYFDSYTNSLVQDLEISNCIFHEAIYNNGELHLATNLGLYRYNTLTKVLALVFSQHPVQNIIYEELDDLFLFSSGNQILGYQQGSVPNILYDVNDSIKKLMLIYNK